MTLKSDFLFIDESLPTDVKSNMSRHFVIDLNKKIPAHYF